MSSTNVLKRHGGRTIIHSAKSTSSASPIVMSAFVSEGVGNV
jgi:hypothetical protein